MIKIKAKSIKQRKINTTNFETINKNDKPQARLSEEKERRHKFPVIRNREIMSL